MGSVLGDAGKAELGRCMLGHIAYSKAMKFAIVSRPSKQEERCCISHVYMSHIHDPSAMPLVRSSQQRDQASLLDSSRLLSHSASARSRKRLSSLAWYKHCAIAE